MKNMILNIKEPVSDIIPIFAGYEACAPSHSFGPAVRDYHLIHLCLTGHGRLFDKFGEHEVYAGECFIIRPGEITTYTADAIDPWNYAWIAFRGALAERFSTERSVYEIPAELSFKLSSLVKDGITSPDIYSSIIYELSYHISSNTESPAPDRLAMVRRYIRYNYMEELTVDGLARSFGFERSYLFRLFKSKYAIGVKDYITEVRMKNAKRFLSEGHSVNATAAMVGYGDEFNFSKAFKRYFGISASEFKKMQ